MEGKPVITLTAERPILVKQIRLTLDSNLSREITPSINRAVLGRQEMNPPSELIRNYTVEFLLNGNSVNRLSRESMGQRLQIIGLEDKIRCDSVSIRVESTYGSPLACIFEIRLYDGEECEK